MRASKNLRLADGAGVVVLIDVLGDDARADEHEAICEALVALGTDSLGPMIAALACPIRAWRRKWPMFWAAYTPHRR